MPNKIDKSTLLKIIKHLGKQLIKYANKHVQTKEPAYDCLWAASLLDRSTEYVGPRTKRTSIEKINDAAGCLVSAANSDTDEDFTRKISYFKKEKIFDVIEKCEYDLDKIDQYIKDHHFEFLF